MITTRDQAIRDESKQCRLEDRKYKQVRFRTMKNESDYTICVVDTETSGLRAGIHEALSLCVMPLNDKFERMGQPFNVRIKAVNPCDPRALAINKLDPTIGFTKAEAWTKLKEWRKSAMIEKIVPLGHNIHFDLPFILMIAPSPEEFQDMFHYHNRDTMAIASIINDIRVNAGLPKMFQSVSLAKVAATFGFDTKFAHSAEGDCEMTRLIYKKMIGMLSCKTQTS